MDDRSAPGSHPTTSARVVSTETMVTSAFEIAVFISHRNSMCDECKRELGRGAWIDLVGDQSEGERRSACLACADLGHLDFLASGDTVLTRREEILAAFGSRAAVEQES